jgi:hypothetical protein
MTSQHDAAEKEGHSTPCVRRSPGRAIDSQDDPQVPHIDASALTAALDLAAKPGSGCAARKIAATNAIPIPYDSLMARRRRAFPTK